MMTPAVTRAFLAASLKAGISYKLFLKATNTTTVACCAAGFRQQPMHASLHRTSREYRKLTMFHVSPLSAVLLCH